MEYSDSLSILRKKVSKLANIFENKIPATFSKNLFNHLALRENHRFAAALHTISYHDFFVVQFQRKKNSSKNIFIHKNLKKNYFFETIARKEHTVFFILRKIMNSFFLYYEAVR